MGGGVAGHPLDVPGRVDQALDLWILLVHLPQLWVLLQGGIQRDMQLVWDGLCHHIGLGIAHIQRPGHIPDRTASRHGAEGNNLGNPVLAVLPRHIVDDLPPALLTEIRIKVRHGYPLRIQKTLKNQGILHRVNLCDVHTVGGNGACAGASAGSHGDALILGPADEVRHNQEVLHIAHLFNHADLIVQTLPIFGGRVRIALGKALLAELMKVAQAVRTVRRFKGGQMVVPEFKLHIAALGNAEGIFKGIVELGKQLPQLVLGFDVKFIAFKAHPVGVVHSLAHLNAHQHVLGGGILPAQIMGVVRHHQGQLQLPGQPHQQRVYLGLLGNSVVLKLQIEMLQSENPAVLQGNFLRALIVVDFQPSGNGPGQTGGQGNQPLGMLPQQLQVDTGPVIKSL